MGKRIAVLVSGGGTNLQALIDAQGKGELGGGQIVAVIVASLILYVLWLLLRPNSSFMPGFYFLCK